MCCLVWKNQNWVQHLLPRHIQQTEAQHTHASFFPFYLQFVTFPFSQSLRRKTPESFLTPHFLALSTRLHVISHYVLSGLILNRHSHLFLPSVLTEIFLFQALFPFTQSWKPNWPFCHLFSLPGSSFHPTLVKATALPEAFRPHSPCVKSKSCNIQHLAIFSPTKPSLVINCTKPHCFFTHLRCPSLFSHPELLPLLISLSNFLTHSTSPTHYNFTCGPSPGSNAISF